VKSFWIEQHVHSLHLKPVTKCWRRPTFHNRWRLTTVRMSLLLLPSAVELLISQSCCHLSSEMLFLSHCSSAIVSYCCGIYITCSRIESWLLARNPSDSWCMLNIGIHGCRSIRDRGDTSPQSSGWGDANGFVPPKVELCFWIIGWVLPFHCHHIDSIK